MLGTIVLASALSLSVAWAANAKPVDGRELKCMALSIYWEARGESEAAKRAIAHVVLNRTQDPDFPSTICGVVKQSETGPPRSCQFSWWCDGRSDRPRDREAWQKAQEIAREVAYSPDDDPSNGALYFHHVLVRPEWREEFQVVARIDDHIFYAPADAGRPPSRDALASRGVRRP